jgi:hypothetical protein
MAKAFIAAVPLTLVLLTAVVVTLALTPGSFGFHSWPASPVAPPRENAVVIDEPVSGVVLARARKQKAEAVASSSSDSSRAGSGSGVAARERSRKGSGAVAPGLVAVRPPSRQSAPVRHGGGGTGSPVDEATAPAADTVVPVPPVVAANPGTAVPVVTPEAEARPAAPAAPGVQPPVATPPLEEPAPVHEQPQHGHGHDGQLIPWWILGGRHGDRDREKSDREDTNLP